VLFAKLLTQRRAHNDPAHTTRRTEVRLSRVAARA
jgi:hypothetical protein